MGRIIIVSSEDDCPKSIEKHIRREIVQPKDIPKFFNETSEVYFNTLMQIGGNTTVGAKILAAIHDSNTDIYVIPIFSYHTDSQFDPEIPAVIYNFGTTGFIASAEPKPMRATIMFFHELGHCRQWIQRRDWFTANSTKQSKVDGYFKAIEGDNLVVHEWPMCKELGEPSRMSYTDFFNNKEDALTRFTETTKAATTLQAIIRGRNARVAYTQMLSKQGI